MITDERDPQLGNVGHNQSTTHTKKHATLLCLLVLSLPHREAGARAFKQEMSHLHYSKPLYQEHAKKAVHEMRSFYVLGSHTEDRYQMCLSLPISFWPAALITQPSSFLCGGAEKSRIDPDSRPQNFHQSGYWVHLKAYRQL